MTDTSLAHEVVESSTDVAIMTFDVDGLITSWNLGAEQLPGWIVSDSVGRHGRIIFNEEDQWAGSPKDEMRRADAEGRALDERYYMRSDESRFCGSGLLVTLNRTGQIVAI